MGTPFFNLKGWGASLGDRPGDAVWGKHEGLTMEYFTSIHMVISETLPKEKRYMTKNVSTYKSLKMQILKSMITVCTGEYAVIYFLSNSFLTANPSFSTI
jgi:hypothetical protein